MNGPKFNYATLARREIVDTPAYSSARSLYQSANTGSKPVFLDANETSESDSDIFSGAKQSSRGFSFSRYPDPQPIELRRRLAELYQVSDQELLVTRGIDEGLEVLFKTFVDSKHANPVFLHPPTYGIYEILCRQYGGRELTFSPSNPVFPKPQTEGVQLVILCQPNNPTGTALSIAAIESLYETLPPHALLIVDEAYQEFSTIPSSLHLRASRPRLITFRTLSKAWGLAGVRIGSLIAPPEAIQILSKALAPYPISHAQSDVALERISPQNKVLFATKVREIQNRRDEFADFLAKIAWIAEVFSSQANFILFRLHHNAPLSAPALVKTLRERGFLLRDRSRDAGLEGCVRVSIGSATEMNQLKKELLCL